MQSAANNDRPKSKGRQAYAAPSLTRIELVSDEVMLQGCKMAGSADGPGNDGMCQEGLAICRESGS